MVSEETFYTDKRGVRITATRAIFPGAKAQDDSITYSMANLSSVRTSRDPAKRARGITVAVIGLVVLYLWLGTPVVAAGGGLMLVVGALMAYLAKTTYHLKITSASGEHTPVSSTDRAYIEKLTTALNDAIISRG